MPLSENNLPITIAVSGASGIVYALRLIEFLTQKNYKLDIVYSKSAIRVAKEELNLNLDDKIRFLSCDRDVVIHDLNNVAAPISSGSYKSRGMIIVPCSMGTASAVANGSSDNLLTRAADVCLKERRRLVVVPREMPYSTLHLENLFRLSQYGVIVAPASPGFYSNPKTIDDCVDFVVGKILDVFGIDNDIYSRWSLNRAVKV